MNSLTYSQKKYLFAIYKLGKNGGDVSSSEVAKLVGVSKASTAVMVAKLCERGYITKEYYGKIGLTESGVKAANSIYTSCITPQRKYLNLSKRSTTNTTPRSLW